jgi:hypothetical protein
VDLHIHSTVRLQRQIYLYHFSVSLLMRTFCFLTCKLLSDCIIIIIIISLLVRCYKVSCSVFSGVFVSFFSSCSLCNWPLGCWVTTQVNKNWIGLSSSSRVCFLCYLAAGDFRSHRPVLHNHGALTLPPCVLTPLRLQGRPHVIHNWIHATSLCGRSN